MFLSSDKLFTSDALVAVLAISSKVFWISICLLGPVILTIGNLTKQNYIVLLGWLAVLFWWSFAAAIIFYISPLNIMGGDCVASAICAFWLFLRRCQRQAV